VNSHVQTSKLQPSIAMRRSVVSLTTCASCSPHEARADDSSGKESNLVASVADLREYDVMIVPAIVGHACTNVSAHHEAKSDHSQHPGGSQGLCQEECTVDSCEND